MLESMMILLLKADYFYFARLQGYYLWSMPKDLLFFKQ